MFMLIKCVLGLVMMLGGAGLQQRSRNKDRYEFLTGTEAVLAGLIIIATA